jgi:poly-gamma-glutamate capsule biosynthesis protein CapA/YwtB (metallophosphatase superfamily)
VQRINRSGSKASNVILAVERRLYKEIRVKDIKRKSMHAIGRPLITLVVFLTQSPWASAQAPAKSADAAASSRAQSASQPASPDREIALTCSVGNGFTLASVGDLVLAAPHSTTEDPGFQNTVQILRGADIAFGNLEENLIDIPHFKGSPQAEQGGWWLIGVPEVAKDLRKMGFSMVSRANNHATDWGVEGMRETDQLLDEAGVVHAGTGELRASARAARFLSTPKGRVGLISLASSFTPMSTSMQPLGEAPGRPGLNALRTRRSVIVTHEMLENLRKIRDAQPEGSLPDAAVTKPNEVDLFGVHYREGDKPGFSYEMNPVDRREILQSIRRGKENSDFVIVTVHAHEPGNWSEEPADFLPALAHVAIDAGADEFIAHGPHRLRGIEIYKGKPIFYSLGNFFLQPAMQTPTAQDMYEQMNRNSSEVTDYELAAELASHLFFNNNIWFESVIAVSRFENGRLSEIRLYPIDLRRLLRAPDGGIPQLAPPTEAHAILERLQHLSAPYHTVIEIVDNIGVIGVSGSQSHK